MPEVASSVDAEGDVHALRPGVALAGDGGEHDARVDRLQCLVAQARAIEHAAAEVLDHDVAVRGELADDALAFGVLQVEREPALVAVGEAELRRAVPPAVVVVHLADDAEGIEIGARFDLDHVGAEIGQHGRGVGAGRQQAEIEDAHAGEGPVHAASSARSRGGAGRGAKERPFHCTGSCGISSLPMSGCVISARKPRATYCSVCEQLGRREDRSERHALGLRRLLDLGARLVGEPRRDDLVELGDVLAAAGAGGELRDPPAAHRRSGCASPATA